MSPEHRTIAFIRPPRRVARSLRRPIDRPRSRVFANRPAFEFVT
jgi:hypothetical protein